MIGAQFVPIGLNITNLQLDQLEQTGQSILSNDACHSAGSNSRPCVYKANALTFWPLYCSPKYHQLKFGIDGTTESV